MSALTDTARAVHTMVGVTVTEIRRDCANKRDRYQHARAMYTEALRIAPWTDRTALRGELEQALIAYYAAHGQLHTAIHPQPTRLH